MNILDSIAETAIHVMAALSLIIFLLLLANLVPVDSRQNTGAISECLSFEGFQYVSGDCIPIK
jgi:hypothetical protein